MKLLSKDRPIFHLERTKLAMTVQGPLLNDQLAARRKFVANENARLQ